VITFQQLPVLAYLQLPTFQSLGLTFTSIDFPLYSSFVEEIVLYCFFLFFFFLIFFQGKYGFLFLYPTKRILLVPLVLLE